MTGYRVAVYYFPGYHHDPRYARWHGPEWTEWELVRRAEPRFPGHYQPREPVWGYGDESDPVEAARKIEAAVAHGVEAFIVDWYWYDGAPFLEGALEHGLLGANDHRLKFALMWANHDWMNIHPYKRGAADTVLEVGAQPREQFERATDYIIERYLGDERYWDVNGGLYFSVYDLPTLVRGLGGVAETADALDGFRQRVRAALGRELHLNAVLVGTGVLTTDEALPDGGELAAWLGFDSATAYVALHHVEAHGDPAVDYAEYAAEALAALRTLAASCPLPFYPNVTVGWDASPRTVQSDVYEDLGRYPFTGVLAGATPDAFGGAVSDVRAWADELGQDVITVNAWNEWTEGSYLEPDTRFGMRFLEQLRDRLD